MVIPNTNALFFRQKQQDDCRMQQCCRAFFMEFLSQLCISQENPPTQAFVHELLNIVFSLGKHEQYQDFYPSGEMESSKSCPMIRSYLLQLLFEHRYVTLISVQVGPTECRIMANECLQLRWDQTVYTGN